MSDDDVVKRLTRFHPPTRSDALRMPDDLVSVRRTTRQGYVTFNNLFLSRDEKVDLYHDDEHQIIAFKRGGSMCLVCAASSKKNRKSILNRVFCKALLDHVDAQPGKYRLRTHGDFMLIDLSQCVRK